MRLWQGLSEQGYLLKESPDGQEKPLCAQALAGAAQQKHSLSTNTMVFSKVVLCCSSWRLSVSCASLDRRSEHGHQQGVTTTGYLSLEPENVRNCSQP